METGTRLGSFEILEPIGEGGMGVVYKARDTRLGRSVAIKVLPDVFANDPERVARMQREAQVLATLNHPHIATIYGMEDRAIVMELVEGKTLEGPVPVEEATRIARQIAEGLEAAHEKGIIHRDLKPANIKLTAEGNVKILDFGLARALASDPTLSHPASSPTLTIAATTMGVILGTAAYMSPEQARGVPVDRRSDIWSFGVVLYELLTGKRLFQGDSVTDTLAAVIRQDIDFSVIPSPLRPLLQRCLERDRKQRLQDIGEARILLEHPAPVTPQKEAMPRRSLVPWAVAAACLALAVVTGFVNLNRKPPETGIPARFTLPLPDDTQFDRSGFPAISPDGRHVAFTAFSKLSQPQIWVRSMDSLQARPLPGTEEAGTPFWSPDSRSLAFVANGKLRKVDLAGGPPSTITDLEGATSTGAWAPDGTILVTCKSVLHQVNAGGGEPKPVLELDKARGEEWQGIPRFLPDGKHFVYVSWTRDPEKRALAVAALGEKQGRVLFRSDSHAEYTPSGHLVYLRQGTLVARPFDPVKLEFRGEPVPLMEHVIRSSQSSRGGFAAANNGTIVIRQAGSEREQFALYERSGRRVRSVGPPGVYTQANLSSDDRNLAVQMTDPQSRQDDIWLLELKSGIMTRHTLTNARDQDPIWSPDGKQVLYLSRGVQANAAALMRKAVGGAREEKVADVDSSTFPEEWLKDGGAICVNMRGKKIFRVPFAEGGKPQVVLESEFDKDEMHLSPDGKWAAYGSSESGRWEVYVASFPDLNHRRQISASGGFQPLWRRDGKELFYLGIDGKLCAAELRVGPNGIENEAPKELFQTRIRVAPNYDQYAVTANGKEFILMEPEMELRQSLQVILNWPSLLRK
jgi:serine/threonine protein kinase